MSDEDMTPGPRIDPARMPGYTFDPEVLWNAYSFTNPRLAFTLGLMVDLPTARRSLRHPGTPC